MGTRDAVPAISSGWNARRRVHHRGSDLVLPKRCRQIKSALDQAQRGTSIRADAGTSVDGDHTAVLLLPLRRNSMKHFLTAVFLIAAAIPQQALGAIGCTLTNPAEDLKYL